MNPAEIRAELVKLPADAAIALAIRMDLRILPLVSLNLKKTNIYTSWEDRYPVDYLLGLFFDIDIGIFLIKNQRTAISTRKKFGERIRTSASGQLTTQLVCKVYQERIMLERRLESFDMISDFKALENLNFESQRVAAISITNAIKNLVAFDHLSDYYSILRSDLDFLGTKNVAQLLLSPIWFGKPPHGWRAIIATFETSVRALKSDFDVWLDWYDERCRGGAIDVELLKQRIFLPESIASQSASEINAYLANLNKGLAGGPLNRVRTIFIGDGEAGKTSLIRVLNGEPVVEGIEAKTPGIEIREWKIPETDITASFWDFGGQVMVHATHQLFLRESCLYVLLVSAREKEKATERAEYWLEHVKSFGRSAPVLIVSNKADKEPVRLDEGLLMEKYPGMIVGFFQLSCTDTSSQFRSRLEEFRAALCQQLQAVGLHQVQFMKPHFAVLQNLRERTPSQAFLTHADYNVLCDEQKVDAHGALDRHWLLDILDKLGVIVHFPDMIEMDEYILNPRWLTYGVYTLMYNEQARITRAQAVALLAAKPVTDQYGNQLSYPASKCRIVFEAMRKYKLCYFVQSNQNPDQDQIIIPALLPSDIKQHGFDTASALEFHYQFESFLPRHLISELIVECHTDIAKLDGQDIVWQHGVLLDNATHQTQALIQADYHFRRLSIWLSRGPRMADMLALLRDRVEQIVKRIDIAYERKIRLPREALRTSRSSQVGQELADFAQILTLRDKKQSVYYHASGSEYSIAKILGLYESKSEKGKKTVIKIKNSKLGNLTAADDIIDSFNEPMLPKRKLKPG